MKNHTKTLTTLAIAVSLAMILSYIEFLLPPVFSAVPGIKLGLANIVVIFLLYRMNTACALGVSFVRVCLSALLFGTALTFAYSLAGAVLSFSAMLLLKKCRLFSTVGVSIAGGVMHNLGQILMAAVLLGTREIIYYMAVLAVTGTLAGVLVGLVSALVIKRVPEIK